MNRQIPFLLFFILCAQCLIGQNWYEMKSGIIRSEVNAGGIILRQTEFFDEWGNSIAIETIMGVEEHALTTRTVYGDKYMTMIKSEENKAIRYPRVRPRINWLELDDVTSKIYDVRYLGKVDLKGYKCDLYKYTIDDNGSPAEVTNWVYKGIPIQYTTVNNGVELQQEFISLEENADVSHDLFEIPPHVEINELTQK